MAKKKPKKETGLDLIFRGLLTNSPSQAVSDQEAAGQQSLVGSDVLPTEMRDDEKEALEAAGIEFLDVVQDDPLFQYVELPVGWEKVPTDHSMWSKLVDEKGHKRADIFYKAAAYDRRAYLAVTNRYDIKIDSCMINDEIFVAMIRDREKVIHSVEVDRLEDDQPHDTYERARKLAADWLDEHYPQWKSVSAYWD